jgi:hypothetical protein
VRAGTWIALACAALGAIALLLPARAGATLREEQALAERYAPVVRIVEQTEECGPGEPYEPMDVDALFGEPTVALRGPWNRTDLVSVGPAAKDLPGLYEYHLDFPGDALEPGCDYERWARRITSETAPTVYAHVASDAGYPDKIALQYWLFYAFNDFNNLHEGDWEMVQLVFDAGGPGEALSKTPTEVGYSSHQGAERADWSDEKLELVDDTHPVVYPAAGSHANKYTDALYLGSSGEAGVGCDDTRGPHVELRPVVATIPSAPDAASRASPWIAFQGRWGELQRAFFNGPTGPNLKRQWTAPIEWSQNWGDRSYAVPTGGILGTGATDFFCTAVATGSRGLVELLRSPGPHPPRARSGNPALDLRGDAHDLASRDRAPRRPPAQLGSDPLRRRSHVRCPRAPLSRHRGAPDSSRRSHLSYPGARALGIRPARNGLDRRVGRSRRAAGVRDRDDAGTARSCARPGGNGVRPRRS